MIKLDEDALICDLAETYQIYDYKQLPPTMVAVFSCGLREESRIKMKLGGRKVPTDTLLLAGISDRVNTLIWFQTKDGQKGKNRPASIADMLLNGESEPQKDVVVFNSGEDFAEKRQRLLKGGE